MGHSNHVHINPWYSHLIRCQQDSLNKDLSHFGQICVAQFLRKYLAHKLAIEILKSSKLQTLIVNEKMLHLRLILLLRCFKSHSYVMKTDMEGNGKALEKAA